MYKVQIHIPFFPPQVPDVNPSTVRANGGRFSMAAGDFQEIYLRNPHSWDCVASCFFIDTANNILQYLRTISRVLENGGYWVNFGPLLYHFADMRGELSIELSYEELKAAMPYYGMLVMYMYVCTLWFARV